MKRINELKEKQLLDFIRFYWVKFGKAPKVKDMAKATDRLSQSISRQLKSLMERGILDEKYRVIEDKK